MAELSDKRAKIIKADNIIAHNANLEFETATLHSVVRELKDELAAREKQLRIVRKAEIGWAAAQKQESPKGGANSAFAAITTVNTDTSGRITKTSTTMAGGERKSDASPCVGMCIR